MKNVRVRYAPSPTGYLHVGGARTALYNFLFARRHEGGRFILRIEDTDEARSTDESLRMVLDDLKWLSLTWDEGPDPFTLKDVGSHGPYRQSQRLDLYKKYADELLSAGKAYYCFMTDAEIDLKREELTRRGLPPHVQSPYEDLPIEKAQGEIASGRPAVIRFKTRNLKKDYRFVDLVRGEIVFPTDMVGDFVLLRSGGMPVYNFCNAVDDHLMEISHVLRGEEHLSNTLRQLMIYESLGWTPPEFGHLSLILDEDRKKLSKRKGATSCHEFQLEGYLPEALNNFIALLGWSDPQNREILTMQQMVEGFSVERLHPAGAVFDAVKLKWMNSIYLRDQTEEQFWKIAEEFEPQLTARAPVELEWRKQFFEIFKSTFETLVDVRAALELVLTDLLEFYGDEKEIETWPETAVVLKNWRTFLEGSSSEKVSAQDFLDFQAKLKTEESISGKKVFMPLRVGLTGKPHGIDLKLALPLISKPLILSRLQKTHKHFGWS